MKAVFIPLSREIGDANLVFARGKLRALDIQPSVGSAIVESSNFSVSNLGEAGLILGKEDPTLLPLKISNVLTFPPGAGGISRVSWLRFAVMMSHQESNGYLDGDAIDDCMLRDLLSQGNQEESKFERELRKMQEAVDRELGKQSSQLRSAKGTRKHLSPEGDGILLLTGEELEEGLETNPDTRSSFNEAVGATKKTFDAHISYLTALAESFSAPNTAAGLAELETSAAFVSGYLHSLRDIVLYVDWYREKKTKGNQTWQVWELLTKSISSVDGLLADDSKPKVPPIKIARKPQAKTPETTVAVSASEKTPPSRAPRASTKVKRELAKLDALTGQDSAKAAIHDVVNTWTLNAQRREMGLPEVMATSNFVFIGNPGTGKTTVARILARILNAMGVLGGDSVVEASRADLVGEYIGHTAVKTREVLESARGGILFIDEAYQLSIGGENDFGQEAITEIMKFMEDNRDDLVVIAAGYRDEMRKFLKSNPGLDRRFATTVEFTDFSTSNLSTVFEQMAAAKKLILTEGVMDEVAENIELARKRPNFGNAGFVRTLFEATLKQQSSRLIASKSRAKREMQTITRDDVPPARSGSSDVDLAQVLTALNNMVGLDGVKSRIQSLISKVKVDEIRKEKGLPVSDFSPHLVFVGAPGTGKTTVARLIGQAFRELGLLRSGHVIETDRSGLVAGYTGQTALKTLDVCESARDGVLFIDEAYSLVSEGQQNFGEEAIETLLKFMEDNRGQIVVIAAGYAPEMKNFIASNPGLARRFDFEIDFPNYSLEELQEIATNECRTRGYEMAEGTIEELRRALERRLLEKDFGNAGEIRKLLDRAILSQNSRLIETGTALGDGLTVLLPEDIRNA